MLPFWLFPIPMPPKEFGKMETMCLGGGAVQRGELKIVPGFCFWFNFQMTKNT